MTEIQDTNLVFESKDLTKPVKMNIVWRVRSKYISTLLHVTANPPEETIYAS